MYHKVWIFQKLLKIQDTDRYLVTQKSKKKVKINTRRMKQIILRETEMKEQIIFIFNTAVLICSSNQIKRLSGRKCYHMLSS